MSSLSNMEQNAVERGFRIGFEQGYQLGLQLGSLMILSQVWEFRFGNLSRPVLSQLTELSPEQSQALIITLLAYKPKSEVMAWLKAQVAQKPTTQKRK
ncbi:MAG TPA: hypothetical protein VFZ34_19820 [Blastocatellia bacterium]|nr:hypothetical protein [Blastocatellia bacterium]